MKVETININHELFNKIKIQKISDNVFFITPLFAFRKKHFESNGILVSKNELLTIKKNKNLSNYNISKNCGACSKILKDLYVNKINNQLKGGKSSLNIMENIISKNFKLSNKESKIDLLKKIAFLLKTGCKSYSTINRDLSGDYRIKITVEKDDEKIFEIEENVEVDIDDFKIKNKKKTATKQQGQKGGDGYSYNLGEGNIAGMPIIDKYYKCCPPVYCDNTINYMKGGGYLLAVDEPKIGKQSAVQNYSNNAAPIFCNAAKNLTGN
jgi:hypothetical protein